MLHQKKKGQPIDNNYVNGIRWNPSQILAECNDETGFVEKWVGDMATYPTITDREKRVEVLKLAWATAMQNIADNEAAGTSIVEKKK